MQEAETTRQASNLTLPCYFANGGHSVIFAKPPVANVSELACHARAIETRIS